MFFDFLLYILMKQFVVSGNFRMVKEMCTELVVPDLTNFTLKPYIGPGAKRHIKDETVAVTVSA